MISLFLSVSMHGAQDRGDEAAIARIRDEGLNRSRVEEPFDMLVNVIGPRLTGSPAHRRAAEFVRQTLESWGMSNAHLESWEFGRGWELQKLTLEMIEPRYMPLIGYAEAWTPSTAGELTIPAVMMGGRSTDELARTPVQGAAALVSPVIQSFIDRDRQQPTVVDGARIGAPQAPRQPGTAAPPTATSKAAVIVKASAGMHGTVFVQAQSGDRTPNNTQPAVVLAAEHYNMIARYLQRNIPVKLRINVQTKFYDDRNSYNVIAEIPGADPVLKDQVVMLGAHFDSWHSATGATDNADGVAAVMEAFRILKAAGLQPKRTLRLALWSGEEQGLLGSKAYVASHLAGPDHQRERDKMDVYFNIDPGYGPIYGWYIEGNSAAKTLFDGWLGPLKDLGVRSNIAAGIGNTDHLSFRAPDIGIPAFNVIQEYADYDVRLHHTNADTAERVKLEDLKQNAIVLASFVYQAAQRTDRIPRGN